jgi:hypothetical protein
MPIPLINAFCCRFSRILGWGALRDRELLRLREEERRELVPPRVDFGLVVRRLVVVLRLPVRALVLRVLFDFRLVVVFFLAIAQMFLCAL